MDFSSLPAGFIPLGVFTTGSGDITESVSGYSYDGHWIP
jgi:hypothetical protein